MADQLGIHYQYAEDAQQPTPERARLNGGLDLSPLSPELRMELKTAAELLDAETVEAIVERIMADHPKIAEAIKAWTEVYRFDVVARLCQDRENQTE